MKLAYPNFDAGGAHLNAYNLNKWLDAMKSIYAKLNLGAKKLQAFAEVTDGWGEVEKFDFNAWMEYYQGGNQLKYKKAQYYVNDNIPDYFIPNPIRQEALEKTPSINFNEAKIEQQLAQEKRQKIEEQRKKMLGRLHSLEKLIASSISQELFDSEEMSKLVRALYDLKIQIQTLKKVSLSSTIYRDLILRKANSLSNQGFFKSAQVLSKFAQNVPGDVGLNANPAIPAAGSGGNAQGTLENNAPNVAQLPPSDGKGTPSSPALSKLLDNLNTSGLTDSRILGDDSKAEDDESDEIEVELDDELTSHYENLLDEDIEDLVVEAQAAANVPNDKIKSLQIKKEDGIEVSQMPSKDFDSMLDNALAGITVNDVIKKLDDIATIFRNRQLSRELATVDLMMEHLGISSLFPGLSEASAKLLDSTGYVLTRLDDIISRLRGASYTPDLQLDQSSAPPTEEARAVQEKLQNERDKEQAQKQMRKQLQNMETEQSAKELQPEKPAEPVQEDGVKIETPASLKPAQPVSPGSEITSQPVAVEK